MVDGEVDPTVRVLGAIVDRLAELEIGVTRLRAELLGLAEFVDGVAERVEVLGVRRERPDARKLMTTLELAEELGMSQWTVRAWHHKGVGPPAYKIGYNVRYRRGEVEEWLALCRFGGEDPEVFVPHSLR